MLNDLRNCLFFLSPYHGNKLEERNTRYVKQYKSLNMALIDYSDKLDLVHLPPFTRARILAPLCAFLLHKYQCESFVFHPSGAGACSYMLSQPLFLIVFKGMTALWAALTHRSVLFYAVLP